MLWVWSMTVSGSACFPFFLEQQWNMMGDRLTNDLFRGGRSAVVRQEGIWTRPFHRLLDCTRQSAISTRREGGIDVRERESKSYVLRSSRLFTVHLSLYTDRRQYFVGTHSVRVATSITVLRRLIKQAIHLCIICFSGSTEIKLESEMARN